MTFGTDVSAHPPRNAEFGGTHTVGSTWLDGDSNLVFIELKVSRGYDRVVGQLLRYMSWIRKHHADEGQTIRGVIVARDISEDLLLACADLPGVELYEYELRVDRHRVNRT